MGMGMAMPDDVTKQDLIKVISVLCKKLDWIEEEREMNKSSKTGSNYPDMNMKLTLEAIEILSNILEPMMSMDKAMPEDVTTKDLTMIIGVLCRKLNWENENDFEQKKDAGTTSSPSKTVSGSIDGSLIKSDPLSLMAFSESLVETTNEEVNPIDQGKLNVESSKFKEKIPQDLPPCNTVIMSHITNAPADVKERPFSCNKCNEPFSKEQFLRAHNFMRHNENTTKVMEHPEYYPPQELEDINKKQYSCQSAISHSYICLS